MILCTKSFFIYIHVKQFLPNSLPTPKSWILAIPNRNCGAFSIPPNNKASLATSRLNPVLIAKKHLKGRNQNALNEYKNLDRKIWLTQSP